MKNTVKTKLAAGEVVFGTLVSMPSPHLVQLLAQTGLDWLIFDLEHSPISAADIHGLAAATAGTECAPMVRAPHGNAATANLALDAGALGLVIPQVKSVADIQTSVKSALYAPAGNRGVGPIYASARWGLSLPEYLARANDEIGVFILIEDIEAVQNLESLLDVEGIDAAIIAPFDLSASMGVPGQLNHDDVISAIRTAEEGILKAGVALGGAAMSPEDVTEKIFRGYRVITLGYDAFLIQSAVKGLMQST